MNNNLSQNKLVSFVSPLENETVKQNHLKTIKALANRVLGVGVSETKHEAKGLKIETSETELPTLWILEVFNERAAIYQYDSGLTKSESERLAYKDVVLEFVDKNHPDLLLEIKLQINQPTIH